MPLYEYSCECGRTFEELVPMDKRHDVLCSCGRKPQILIGSVFYRMAEFFSVLDHKGNILQQTQTIEKTPPPEYGLVKE